MMSRSLYLVLSLSPNPVKEGVRNLIHCIKVTLSIISPSHCLYLSISLRSLSPFFFPLFASISLSVSAPPSPSLYLPPSPSPLCLSAPLPSPFSLSVSPSPPLSPSLYLPLLPSLLFSLFLSTSISPSCFSCSFPLAQSPLYMLLFLIASLSVCFSIHTQSITIPI